MVLQGPWDHICKIQQLSEGLSGGLLDYQDFQSNSGRALGQLGPHLSVLWPLGLYSAMSQDHVALVSCKALTPGTFGLV